MIGADFVIRDNKIRSFSTEGHAGLADAGQDVLCAAVSAMTQLCVNTVTEDWNGKTALYLRNGAWELLQDYYLTLLG